MQNGDIVETKNIHENPRNNFRFESSVFIDFPLCVATWHTHPTNDTNLSVEDYFNFLKYPQFRHYIVGENEVSHYFVENNQVLRYE